MGSFGLLPSLWYVFELEASGWVLKHGVHHPRLLGTSIKLFLAGKMAVLLMVLRGWPTLPSPPTFSHCLNTETLHRPLFLTFSAYHSLPADKQSIQRYFVQHSEFSLAQTRHSVRTNHAASFQALALSYVPSYPDSPCVSCKELQKWGYSFSDLAFSGSF